MNNDNPHILIVDDDPILQAYLEINLVKMKYRVTRISGGEEIENVLRKHRIDLIILDVMLTGRDGFYWLEWLHSQHPQIDVLVLSAKKSDKDRVHGLELGAADYLSKPFHIKEFMIRVSNILRRQANRPTIFTGNRQANVRFGEYQFNIRLNTLIKGNEAVKLTRCETELLAVLCQHEYQVVTRDQLARALNGQVHSPLDRRIDVHINRLRNKIEDNPSKPAFIRTVWGKGYKFYPPTPHVLNS